MRWLLILVFLATVGIACGSSSGSESEPGTEVKVADQETTTTASGLQITVVEVGTGEQAVAGQTAVVHYTGWLLDGTKFDSSVDRGTPFEFPLGAGRVIKGWDEGVATMNIGGKVELIVPPDLAYGARGAGGVIPPNATLKFAVELLGLK
ncbi:MAG: FKBP-type peptidyl-prolyl cis-trans isomerase [Chloroflexi bacterium]|nr:FKBP-type peptidyl-prolyl cis-trans isomerase [Chloroflexota bacterium]MDA1271490.1 FKBP-type peptidyl-prolyl cis-trans isomerase [Chloroflexota bacterium]PKB58603.1 MAG: peptidylprolyl isomerase [SAR202 cluster bacterium Casp-Chloro-G2]